MTREAYEQLRVLVQHAIADNPRDESVRRHLKGLLKSLTRWLRWTQSESQARIETASHDSSCHAFDDHPDLSAGVRHGTQARTQGKD